jgi:hypothetical protein
MANILSQNWLLDRRHFLRGAGAAIALPLLECMTPLRAAAAVPARPKRSVFVYIPNGVNVLTWQITKAGRDYELSGPMQPLAKHRANITPISGLHHPNGIGSLHTCELTWLTGARSRQDSASFRNTVSCDQLMAEVTAPQTRYPSLELSVGRGSATLAWSRDGVPLPAENSSRVVFKRLFGEAPGGAQQERRELGRRRSVLDLVLSDARSLKSNLGTEDRGRLDEYLHSVRDVEVRAQRQEGWLDVPRPSVDAATTANLTRNIPMTDAGDFYRTMYDLIVLAFRTDMTRVVTFMSGTEGNGLALPEIGIAQTRHELSHHNGDLVQMDRLTRSDGFLVEQFAYFLDKLAEVKDGGESLLDRSMVLFGSGMSYGHSHGNANLPTIFAGGKGLGIRHGQHLDYNLAKIGGYQLANPGHQYGICSRPVDGDARLSNLCLTMLQKMDLRTERFVDSSGPISELLA